MIYKKETLIEVINTLNAKPQETFGDYKKVFGDLGMNNVNHIHHNIRKEAMEENLVERIKNADAFFFSGGDQLKLTSIYGGTDFLLQLKERYINDEIVIAGTSAGAMAMST